MKQITLLFSSFLFGLLLSCNQRQNTLIAGAEKPVADISALAVLVSVNGGDTLDYCTYKILKNFSDKEISDTIEVGFQFFTEYNKQPDTVLLNINIPDDHTPGQHNYECLNDNEKESVKPAKISYIDFDYWEGCETGKGKCAPLHFTRTKEDEYYFLIMPCGGTETSVTLSGAYGQTQSTHIFSAQCPPVFNLSSLSDGIFHANMMACGLGGTVEFTIQTTK